MLSSNATLRLIVCILLLQVVAVWANNKPVTVSLDEPVAYCISMLDACTPTQQRPLTDPLPSDLRELNPVNDDPITLVYAIPDEFIGQSGIEMLAQGKHRSHCFQFDNQREQTICTHRQLTWITLPDKARFFYTQNVERDLPRLTAPVLTIGQSRDLHQLIQQDRDPILSLTGWYVFLSAAALFQMLSPRNRVASLCLAIIGLTVMTRTIILSNNSFAGLSVFGGTIDRRLEYVAIPLIAACALTFYGSLVANRYVVARRVLQALSVMVGVYIVIANTPDHVYWSSRLALILTLPILLLGIFVTLAASKILDMRERVVMWTGFSVMAVGMLADVFTSLAGLTLFAGIGFFSYCFAFETLCQYILISMRNEAAHKEALLAHTQAQYAQTVAQQVQSDALLIKAQNEAQQSYNAALLAQAEMARKENEHTQKQLQQADKMATLGQLVASVTHEINTPIGAISSSGQSMTESLQEVVQQLPPLLQELDAPSSQLLVRLLQQASHPRAPMSSREERIVVKTVAEQLEQTGLEHARQNAQFLVSMNAHLQIDTFRPLLVHPQAEKIQQAARNLTGAIHSANNVNVAVERVIKIVKALKSFSHFHVGDEKIEADLVEGIETVLTIYQGQTKVGVDVVRNYETVPPLRCFPDELNQVWTNLIHNALQAMNHIGTLTISVRKLGTEVRVSISDTGCGIPEAIRSKIFDVFFTTKPAGVGSGLGLDIVKKIIEKHQGRIELESEVGIGSTFTVILPYATEAVGS